VVPIRARHIQDGGGRHFEKKVKSPYLSNRLTDFHEIWQAGADWPPTKGKSLKFPIFQKKPDGGGSHLEKLQKSRYHDNGLTDLREIWHGYAKWIS